MQTGVSKRVQCDDRQFKQRFLALLVDCIVPSVTVLPSCLASFFDPEDGSNMLLRNTGKLLQYYTKGYFSSFFPLSFNKLLQIL
jgi:hypothetical protein